MNPVDPTKIIFPFYHAVSNTELLHLKHLYRVKTVREFQRDLDLFLKFYKPISVDDLLMAIRTGEPLRKRSFLLTFDDGFSQIYDVVVPILKEKGVPAIFFLNPAFLNNKDLFYRCQASILIDILQKKVLTKSQQSSIRTVMGKNASSTGDVIRSIFAMDHTSKPILCELAQILEYSFDTYLKQHMPYMTDDQVGSIVRAGFAIGSHGLDHIKLNRLEYSDQIRQVKESLEYLNNRFSLRYKLFSFPFTDDGISELFFQTMFDAKNPLLDLSFGTAGMKFACVTRHLQRIPMEKFPHTASGKLLFQYFYWLLKMPLGKNRIKRH